jgi:hypothetical protein
LVGQVEAGKEIDGITATAFLVPFGALVVAAVVEPSGQSQQAQFPFFEVVPKSDFSDCFQHAPCVLKVVKDVLRPDFFLKKICQVLLCVRQDIGVGCCHSH